MQNWKLILAYDGTPYHGWQVQPVLPTVQGTLAAALCRLTGEEVLPQGSGRTDAGVHALGQVASFALAAPIPPEKLQYALNRALPSSIRVLSAEHAEAGFHARHSAARKTYEYRIFRQSGTGTAAGAAHAEHICMPSVAPYVWDCPWPVALDRVCRAAATVVGEHDFTSFAASDPDLATREGDSVQGKNALRTIFRSCWQEEDGLLVYRVTGSGFLHHMVRNLVGTFVDVGAGRLEAEAIPGILAARSRAAAGVTAPAQGLFLVSVEYASC